MLHVPGLIILDSTLGGRGVFCAHDLAAGDIIEVCPIIKIPTGQLQSIDPTILYEYYFLWNEEGFEACIALGYGSLYNHGVNANVEIILDYTSDEIIFKAIRDIRASQELLIDYQGGDEHGDQKSLWFIVNA